MRVCRLVVPLLFAATLPLSAPTDSATSSFRRHQSLLHVLGYAAGGMVLGGWGGYMTSQLVRSDWTDTTGRGAERLRFSLGGAAVGLLAVNPKPKRDEARHALSGNLCRRGGYDH